MIEVIDTNDGHFSPIYELDLPWSKIERIAKRSMGLMALNLQQRLKSSSLLLKKMAGIIYLFVWPRHKTPSLIIQPSSDAPETL